MNDKLFYGRIDDPNWPCGRWVAKSAQHADELGRPSTFRGDPVSEGWDVNPTIVGEHSKSTLSPLPFPLEIRVNNRSIKCAINLTPGDKWAVFIRYPEQLELFPNYV